MVEVDDRALVPVAVALPAVSDPLELAVASVLSPTTKAMYLRDLRGFVRDLADQPGVHPLEATYADLLRWWNRIRTTPDAEGRFPRPATVNRRVCAVRRFYREARRHGLILQDPAEGLPGLKVSQEPRGRALDWTEVRALLEVAPADGRLPDLRDRLVLWMLLLTGCRVTELVRVQVGDLGRDAGCLVVTFRRKGGKEDRQPLVPELATLVDAWLYRARISTGCVVEACVRMATDEGWMARPGAMSRRAVYDIVESRAQQAGLGPGVGPHDLRKTFATLAHRLGTDLLATADALGHSRLETTRGYVHQVDRYARHPGASILARARATTAPESSSDR